MAALPVLGIDIGSVSVSCALLDASGTVLASGHRAHQGKARETLEAVVAGLAPGRVAGIGITGSGPRLLPAARTVDSLVSLVVACRHLFPSVGSILCVGGERFSLIRFDEAGGYVGTKSNSSCAAGTGSFLDQQARRLGLASSRELAAAALANAGEPPRISTRCAVFARTDLVHAQQSGFTLEEICDGLCSGIARNVAETLLAGEPPRAPVVFAGGVAANEAVRRHLERLFGTPVQAHVLSPVLGAVGAALDLLEAPAGRTEPLDLASGIAPYIAEERGSRRAFYAPLEAAPAGRASADSVRRFVHDAGRFSRQHPVEVEVFREPLPAPDGSGIPAWLGLDVGSTSTKAVLAGTDGEPVVGLYTRTLGRPVTAAQALLEAAAAVASDAGTRWRVLGAASTGAGRKFVGRILGADLVLDEISAHARAAVELDPGVDTIIEIGGQDAKFTTLRDGRVTFAHMNTVCAAGTGSFLEEQALRLGVDLAEYAQRVAGVRAPLASDRCAVFMERDINDLLSLGFSVDEILAASLFAIRENYLQKVARGAAIGSRICFQGATARNRALVSAFEQGLGRPIFVSRYCHLTGALGAALALRDQAGPPAAATTAAATAFRGFDAALAGEVPIRGETCGLCANHCRLRIAEVAGVTVAYGFLCGRDYDTHRYVNANRSGFDLAVERRRAFAAEGMDPQPAPKRPGMPTLGLPAALGVASEMPLWRRFFAELGVPVVTSEGAEAATTIGRNVEGAEFCAPLASLHGHAAWLAGRADWLFLPVRLEELRPGEEARRPYCYYTQFSPALVSALACMEGRVLAPYADWTVHRDRTLHELSAALSKAGVDVTEQRVADALECAIEGRRRALDQLTRRYREEMADAREPRVVLIGRPYTVLAPDMNKGIPAIFGTLGVKTFYQDMVPHGGHEELAPLLGAFHWQYAAEALETAFEAARTPMLYPVYVTAFKCSPDSFALDAFRRILEAYGKPYLVLQLDDLDSSMGYETRIEAGVRAFRNHAERAARHAASAAGSVQSVRALRAPPRAGPAIAGRTLLLPDFDSIAGPLVAANLRREGVDARLLHEDETSIRAAMRHNTGQCIPLNAIVQAAVETIRLADLDPSRTLVWMSRSNLACNLPLFPLQMQHLFETIGGGMEQVRVYVGDISFIELSARVALNIGRAYLFAGFVRKVACRLRPYETEPGATDRAVAEAIVLLSAAFADGSPRHPALEQAMRLFDMVPVAPGRRPKVAIFGDLYVRDNDVFNQGLVRAIEEAGGEAVVTPPADFARIIVGEQRRRWHLEGQFQQLLLYSNLVRLLDRMARHYHRHAARFLGPFHPVRMSGAEEFLARFGVRTEHFGESMENLLKIYHLAREHPDLRLFVQASPAFCCPSLVTEAMARDIQRVTGVPVVSLTYDGTGRYRNDAIVPYLRFSRTLDA